MLVSKKNTASHSFTHSFNHCINWEVSAMQATWLIFELKHQIALGQSCLRIQKIRLVIQILYLIISNIFQNDWLLTIYEIFLDVDRHQLKKHVFGWHSFICFSCSCFFNTFLLYPLIFIFVSYFFVSFVLFHSFSVLIPKIFHYLYLYLLSY